MPQMQPAPQPTTTKQTESFMSPSQTISPSACETRKKKEEMERAARETEKTERARADAHRAAIRKAEAQEAAQLKAEAKEAARKKIECEKLEKEQKISKTAEKIEADFKLFCVTHGGYLPPEMLASESCRLFKDFLNNASDGGRYIDIHKAEDHGLFSDAIARISVRFTEMEAKLKAKIRKVSMQLILAKINFSARLRNIVSQVAISLDPPQVEASQLASFNRNLKYISAQYDQGGIARALQSSISIVRDKEWDRSYVQLCSPEFGCIYLTIPSNLNPTEVAHDIMSALARPIATSVGEADPIISLNGDGQDINLKKFLPSKIVLKYSSNTEEKLTELGKRVRQIYSRAPLTATNTKIISGLPFSPQQLAAVFSTAETQADWAIWQDIAPAWSQVSEREAFPVHAQQTSESFLSALQEEENVIVLVAHAETGAIHFPDPAPDGSRVTPEQILSLKAIIQENAPSVYLFCCETAKYQEGIASIKNALLEAGALTVIAPQIQIDANTSRKLFEDFLRIGKKDFPISALRSAERSSRNRDLETWVG